MFTRDESVDDESKQNWFDLCGECTGETGLSTDRLFAILANHRRRFVLQYLLRIDETAPIDDVIKKLTAWETDTPVADLSSAERTRMAVSVRHIHLGKLVDSGTVTYDEDAERLGLGPNAPAVEPYLTLLAAHSNR